MRLLAVPPSEAIEQAFVADSMAASQHLRDVIGVVIALVADSALCAAPIVAAVDGAAFAAAVLAHG